MTLDPREVAVLDGNAAFLGVPTADLMRNAGEAVARVLQARFHPRRVTLLCGEGNNGGDGLVAAARLVALGVAAEVVQAHATSRMRSPEAQAALAAAQRAKVPVHPWGSPGAAAALQRADVLVDALLGVGLRGEPRGAYGDAVRALNAARVPVLAVDVPTGLGTRLAVRPRVTVTFHEAKRGMEEANSGTVVVEPIGIPPKAATHLGPGDLAAFYPRPAAESHKGLNGRVLVVGGGPYAGAPALAGLGALRAGADLVHVAAPASVAATVQSFSPNLIVHALPGDALAPAHLPALQGWLDRSDAVLVGPGLGTAPGTLEAVRHLAAAAKRADVPMVVDADALAAFAAPAAPPPPGSVVTPHAREFLTLTGVELPGDVAVRAEKAKAWAAANRLTVLLKGPVDVVTDGAAVRFNDVHHVAMTHGGTGDVLAGLVATLLAKGAEPFHAARAACFLNGSAGVRAAAAKSYGMTATDLSEAVPDVLRDVLGG